MQNTQQMQRQQAMQAVLGRNRSVIGWVGAGFVAALALGFTAYEQTRVPTGSDARQMFERAFDADSDGNFSFDAAGAKERRNGFKLAGEVWCRVHSDRRGDQAYDYDCIAPIADTKACRRYFAFYVEDSSIGRITRPLSDDVALATLRDFGLLTGKASC